MANKQKKSSQVSHGQDPSLNVESNTSSPKKPSQLKKRINECI